MSEFNGHWETAHVPLGWWFISLLAGLLIAIGPEMTKCEAWREMTTPEWIGHNLHLIGGVLSPAIASFLRKP